MSSAFHRVYFAIELTLHWENLQYYNSLRKVIDLFQCKERELSIYKVT